MRAGVTLTDSRTIANIVASTAAALLMGLAVSAQASSGATSGCRRAQARTYEQRGSTVSACAAA